MKKPPPYAFYSPPYSTKVQRSMYRHSNTSALCNNCKRNLSKVRTGVFIADPDFPGKWYCCMLCSEVGTAKLIKEKK